MQKRSATTLRRLIYGALLTSTWLTPALAGELDRSIDFEVAAQSLDKALLELSKQANFQMVLPTGAIPERNVPRLEGKMTIKEALQRLLQGTDLSYKQVGERTLTVVAGSPDSSSAVHDAGADRNRASFSAAAVDGYDGSISEIVVTGSRVKGAEVASPLLSITQQDMHLAGHATLGEVIRSLPQNFNGSQNPGVAPGANGGASPTNFNLTGGSALSLRGLGPDATLTLLNGVRLPYDGPSQATDVAVIPVAAIERMEVLLDGASAIYGSDAVGGVANIILKRDYEGVELSARYGTSTEGGYSQTQYTAVTGTTWNTGGMLVSGDYSHSNPIRARNRDYLDYFPMQDATIYPAAQQQGALLSGHQQLGERIEFAADAFYTEGENKRLVRLSGSSFSDARADRRIWGAAPSLRFELPAQWSLRLQGAAGRNDATIDQRNHKASTGALLTRLQVGYFNKTQAAGFEAEGPVFSLAGGEARASVGGGYRRNEFEELNFVTGAVTLDGSDSSRYAYGEINLPLFGEDDARTLLTRLSLNAAVRFEDYDSFGSKNTPKLGVVWGVTPGVDIKASWGRSFKVPTLRQQYSRNQVILYPASLLGATGVPANSTALVTYGGNPALGPEEADTLAVGFVVRPRWLRDLTFELSGFDIDYTGRVVEPLVLSTQTLTNPVFAEFITRDPTVDQQNAVFLQAGLTPGAVTTNITAAPYDSANVAAIAHDLFVNATRQKVRGIDLSVRHAVAISGGTLTTTASASWLDSNRRLTSLAPELATAGVIYFPAKFRGRLGATWSRDQLTVAVHVNHVGSIRNTEIATRPKGGTMTTLDLVLDYQLRTSGLGEWGFNLALINALNEDPPLLQPAQTYWVNYDSTNYSAIGRLVNATLTKRF